MKEKTAPRAADPLSREGLERELGRRFGTAFTKARAGALVVAFDRAADAVQAPSLADLLNRTLRGEPAALDALVRETSIGETYFFREIDGLERVVEVARRIFGDLPRPLTGVVGRVRHRARRRTRWRCCFSRCSARARRSRWWQPT